MNYNETYIDVHHLPPLHNEEQVESKQSHLLPELEEKPLEHLVTEFEGNIIYEYLERFDGNKTQTAKALGISVRNLYYKLEKYDHAKIACNKLRTMQFIAWYTKSDKIRQNLSLFSKVLILLHFECVFIIGKTTFKSWHGICFINRRGRRKGLITKYEVRILN